MNFETIKRILAATTQAQLRQIADQSGIPLPTLIKIRYGQVANPRIKTVEKLAECLTVMAIQSHPAEQSPA